MVIFQAVRGLDLRQSQHVMFDKRALHHVDEFVVAARVGGPEKESRIGH